MFKNNKKLVNCIEKGQEFLRLMENNENLQRDEAACMILDILIYLPNGQQEYNSKILCSKMVNKIIDRIIEEDNVSLDSIEKEI